jgi:hypothetical protein
VIPTAIVAGLVFGRWWWTIFPITLAWALLLATEGTFSFGGVALGFLNAAVGIAVHQAVLAVVRAAKPKPT